MKGKLGIEISTSDTYYFVSYNSEDAERVSSAAAMIQSFGVPLWCDNDIPYGEKWESLITAKIKEAQAVLLLFTSDILSKPKSFVRREYQIAQWYEKDIFVLFLDYPNKKAIPAESLSWWLELQDYQNCIAANFPSMEDAAKDLASFLGYPKPKPNGFPLDLLDDPMGLETEENPDVSEWIMEKACRWLGKPANEVPPKFLRVGKVASAPRYDLYEVSGYAVERRDFHARMLRNAMMECHQDHYVEFGRIQTRIEKENGEEKIAGLTVEIEKNGRDFVSLKETLAHLPVSSGEELWIPLGKGLNDEYVYRDLYACGHIILNGSYGSGKSIFMHAAALSLLYQKKPSEVSLLFIDPKQVEFHRYRVLPHLFCPIIKDGVGARDALMMLQGVIRERLRLFRGLGVSNIKEYRQKKETEALPLSRIAVFIDEFADLVVCDSEVASRIMELLPIADNYGIHFIVGSQKGVVLGNVPWSSYRECFGLRVCFYVPFDGDSIRFLGCRGGEVLLGQGDCLPQDRDSADQALPRLQAPYVSAREAREVISYLGDGKKDFSETPDLPNPAILGQKGDAVAMEKRKKKNAEAIEKAVREFFEQAGQPLEYHGIPGDGFYRFGVADPVRSLFATGTSVAERCFDSMALHFLEKNIEEFERFLKRTIYHQDWYFDVPYAEENLPLPLADALSSEKKRGDIPLGKRVDGEIASIPLSGWGSIAVTGEETEERKGFLQTLIAFLISQYPPERLRVLNFITKTDSLRFDELPHSLCPAIKDNASFGLAMKLLETKMEQRMQTIVESGAFSLAEYNLAHPHDTLPEWLVLFQMDIVYFAPSELTILMRLLSKAHAIGLHFLFLAGPSATLSFCDKRIRFLGEDEAEKLFGQGDFLYESGNGEKEHLQSFSVASDAIEKLTVFWANHSKVAPDPDFVAVSISHKQNEEFALPSDWHDLDEDLRYAFIRKVVQAGDYYSVSRIQREFSVGFPRAARIFARLQEEGIVSKESDGAKGCRVLKRK